MAHLSSKFEWFIGLTPDELRLILKALGGRLKPEEIAAAAALGNKITRLRVEATESVMRFNNKLLSHLDQ